VESLLVLIPISLIIVGLIVAVLLWAVQSGQFDDLDRPADRILDDDP
jgi:cbb3-type cytochrome oxidase maturation protein